MPSPTHATKLVPGDLYCFNEQVLLDGSEAKSYLVNKVTVERFAPIMFLRSKPNLFFELDEYIFLYQDRKLSCIRNFLDLKKYLGGTSFSMKLFGKTPIKLDSTVFEFREVVFDLPQQNFIVGTTTRMMVDFGMVILIDPRCTVRPRHLEFLEDNIASSKSPVFTAPVAWDKPDVLVALGAFKSRTAAIDNGWGGDIVEGLDEHQVKIRGIKGLLTTFKATTNNKWFTK